MAGQDHYSWSAILFIMNPYHIMNKLILTKNNWDGLIESVVDVTFNQR